MEKLLPMNILIVTVPKVQIEPISLFLKDKKIIKNLGYLNAEKYRKYRDSYKIVKSSIIFKQNTHSNR